MTPLFVPLGTVPIWALCHSLYAHQARLGKAVEGVRKLEISDGSWKNPEAKAIKNLDLMMKRADKLLRAGLPEWSIAQAHLEMLDAGAVLPWEQCVEGEMEAHVGIVTSPASHLYAGSFVYTLAWGDAVLCVAGPGVKRSAANFGSNPRLHLIFTLNKSGPLQSRELEALEAAS